MLKSGAMLGLLLAFSLGSDSCPPHTLQIVDKCVRLECVTFDYRGRVTECDGFGYCIEQSKISWGCKCLPYAVATERSCAPKTCVNPGTNAACSMNGMCVRDTCICNVGHGGTYCEKIITDLCPAHLLPAEGYCIVPRCQGANGLICGGHGDCINNPIYAIPCNCDYDYEIVGTTCYPKTCLGVISNADEPTVCNGHGTCQYGIVTNGWACHCEDGYVSVSHTCVPTTCVNQKTERVCGTHGLCMQDSTNDSYKCVCGHGYRGEYCELCADDAVPLWNGLCLSNMCASYDSEGNLLICNNLGGCEESPLLPAPTCSCSDNAFLKDGNCYPTLCKTGLFQVCSDHGVCTYSGCKCDDGFGGVFCEYKIKTCPEGQTFLEGQCYPSECVLKDNTLCSYFGKCVTDDKTGKSRCICPDNMLQASDGACIPMECIFNGKVCPGMGPCQAVSTEKYECYCNFLTSVIVNGQCVPTKYLTTNLFNEPIICNGRGRYDAKTASCICHKPYIGPICEFCAPTSIMVDGECYPPSCINMRHNGTAAVCGNHGQCILLEPTENPEDEVYGCRCKIYEDQVNLCVSSTCKPYSSGPVCSNHGYCEAGVCICDSGFGGVQCEY